MQHFKPPMKRPDRPCEFCGGSGVGVYGANYLTPCDVCNGTGESQFSDAVRQSFKDYLNNAPLIQTPPDTWRGEIDAVVDADDDESEEE